VRDARLPEPSGMSSTGELIDTEKVTISSEGRRWKSACKSNSLASYPTSRTVLRGGSGGNITLLPGAQALLSRFGKLWTEEGIQWCTDARGVRIIWGY
jgi:hypothetical protein